MLCFGVESRNLFIYKYLAEAGRFRTKAGRVLGG
jgi:hypothetical protein